MTGDPYEEADEQQRFAEAKLVMPAPAKKSRKVVFAGLMLAGLILAVVILANIAGLVTGRVTPEARSLPKPTTMTHQQSDSFAEQQSGQAAYLKGMDRDRALQNNENTVLGEGSDLARDAYAEAAGVPQKTKAQEDAEHGRTAGTVQSEAQQRRERAAFEEEHRRQNDLDSSPVAVDFSDYFEKEKQLPVASVATTNPEVVRTHQSDDAGPVEGGRRGRPAVGGLPDSEREQPETSSRNRQPSDPQDDYAFDSSFGKLYRLLEDTVIESVLANRLTGAAIGPVITMVTTDVYSASGSHLLIPKGTRLLGSVRAVSSVNQERLFVAFHRMIQPDGYSVSLDKFQGLDVVGQTGLRDLVNRHYVQIFGASLALAAVSATAQIGNNVSYGAYDWGVQLRNGVSEGLGQSAQRVMERFLNILPTFTLRERARVKVMLAGDLLLPDIKNHTMDPDL
jgi:type IV secretion system protein TrbI